MSIHLHMSRQTSNDPSGSWKMILLLITAGAAVLMIAPVSADMGVTISAFGDQSYYYGEDVILHGNNSISNATFLFVTGPNLPSGGANLTSPHERAVSGDPGTFTVVKTRPDTTWEYTWYTANLMMDAGSYTLFATSQPTTDDLAANASSSRMSIILKRPFIMAEIFPATVTKGQPFTVNGTAEGNPPSVQCWIIGNTYVFTATTPVNPDAAFTFNGDTQLSGKLPKGQCYLIVQHSMQNNTFDIVASGDYIRSLQGNNGMNLFRIKGAGSLQGRDAADALTAAFSDPKNGDDTFTVIPFMVDDPGTSVPQTQPITTAPAPNQAQPALLPFALIGAVALILGIVVWKRH